tara:strand:+ start:17091 stop:17300 length:210 start_codon:yes stop_codon:yes gene_type:complete
MPSLKQLQAENQQRKKNAMTHITSEGATQRSGYGSDGTKVSQQRREEEERVQTTEKKHGRSLVGFCIVM